MIAPNNNNNNNKCPPLLFSSLLFPALSLSLSRLLVDCSISGYIARRAVGRRGYMYVCMYMYDDDDDAS